MSFLCADSEKLYAEDLQIKRQDVKIIREWLKKQPHLPEMLDLQIIMALHCTYYQVEAAKVVIDNYFTIKNFCPEVFQSLPPDLLKSTLSTVFVQILPKKTPQGYVILMIKLSDFCVDNFSSTHSINLIAMVSLLYLHQIGLVNGAVVLFDAKGFTFGHLTKLNLNHIKHSLDFLQEAAPVRMKEVHVMNAFPLVDKVVAVLRPFLKTELYEMLQFHPPHSESLYESVPKECLPEEYGGQQATCRALTVDNMKKLLDDYEFFEWQNRQVVDESRRLEKLRIGGGFGVDGTFKKLELD